MPRLASLKDLDSDISKDELALAKLQQKLRDERERRLAAAQALQGVTP